MSESFKESVKLCVIKMHSWILQAHQLLHVDFNAFQTYVFYRLLGLQKQAFYGGETRDCRREGGGKGEKGEEDC